MSLIPEFYSERTSQIFEGVIHELRSPTENVNSCAALPGIVGYLTVAPSLCRVGQRWIFPTIDKLATLQSNPSSKQDMKITSSFASLRFSESYSEFGCGAAAPGTPSKMGWIPHILECHSEATPKNLLYLRIEKQILRWRSG